MTASKSSANNQRSVLLECPSGDYVVDVVGEIAYRAYHSCRALTSVTIGDSVTSIGDWAFSSCLKECYDWELC